MTTGRSHSKTHQVGAHFEDAAAAYLCEQGLKLICQNWHVAGVGEVDIILIDESEANAQLVFVEVKARASTSFGGAAASITTQKQQKIIATASQFLAEHEQYSALSCRFDVVAFEGQVMHWFKAAFLAY